MRMRRFNLPSGPIVWVAGILLLYGSITAFLQIEVVLKLVRGALGYGGWAWGDFNDLPTAWEAPTDIDSPVRALYSALTFHQPLLPWLAWVAGCALVLWLSARTLADPVATPSPEARVAAAERPADHRRLALVLGSLVVALVIFGAAAWLRATNLLPGPGGIWTGSNFDEMVYYTQAELFTRGVLAYRDTFMAHPPGVIWAFAPALVLEKAWGGAAAFVASRQWLFFYSLAAVPLAWFAARKLGGVFAATLAAIVIALDGKAAFAPASDRQLPNVGVLETLVNLASLAAFLVFLYAPERTASRRWWLLGAGALAGVAAICKVPGIALLLALLLYSLLARRVAEAGWLFLGGVAGAAVPSLLFFVASPGQMVRQVIFFQLLRPQEVREGIDQASRIASYPEAQLTLLLAGLGILAVGALLWSLSRGWSEEAARWSIPAFWASAVVAVFLISRSYHSQYYTQWVPPLALVTSSLGAPLLWRRYRYVMAAAAVLVAVLALPLAVSQWRAASSAAYDQVYRPVGAALARALSPGGQAMSYNPGYTFAAGVAPAHFPTTGRYVVDTAGYPVFVADGLDRASWGDLLRRTAGGERLRNEDEVLARPAAQAALLGAALGADAVVLDQKIALPKLTAQSVRLLEARSTTREDVGFASLLKMQPSTATSLPPFDLRLAGSFVARLQDDLRPLADAGSLKLSPQDVMQVGLYWQPGPISRPDLRVVVRLIGPGWATAKQVDTEPSEGSDHASSWEPGLAYPDLRNIPLAGLAPGTYRIAVRVYDPATSTSSQEVELPQAIMVK